MKTHSVLFRRRQSVKSLSKLTLCFTIMLLVPILLALLIISGCSEHSLTVNGHDCSEVTNWFFRKPLKAGISEFANLDIDTQYAVYICGNQFIHPPALHLADAFASKGADVVGFLQEQLEKTEDDLTVRDIVLVFGAMSRSGTYDVAGNPKLLSIIEDKVGEMKAPYWREMSSEDLQDILKK